MAVPRLACIRGHPVLHQRHGLHRLRRMAALHMPPAISRPKATANRTTRMSRCPGRTSLHPCPPPTSLAFTDADSPCLRRGPANAPSPPSAAPPACPPFYVNGIAVGLGKDSCPPPSSTSLEPCVSAKKTSSFPSSSRGPTPVSSGIETTGGSPAFSAKCFSTPHPKLNLPAFTPARRLPLNSPRPRSAFFARVGIIGVGPLPQGFTPKGAFLIAKIATFSKNRSSPRSTSPSNVSTTSPATCVLTCTPTAASWWTTTSCSPVPT